MRTIQAYWGKLHTEALDSMSRVRELYQQVEVFEFPESNVPSHESDVWRWKMLCENDDIQWIDWDLYPLKEYTFPQDKISMPFYRGVPEFCWAYSPRKELFLELEKSRIDHGIEQNRFAWDRKVMRFNLNKIHRIPDDAFVHLRITGLQRLREQYRTLNKEKQTFLQRQELRQLEVNFGN